MFRIKSLCIIAIVCMLFCGQAMAQKKVLTDSHLTGHVVDMETGDHLPFVSISVKGCNYSAA